MGLLRNGVLVAAGIAAGIADFKPLCFIYFSPAEFIK